MKYIIKISALVFIIVIGFFIYNKLAYLNILVKFDELEPYDKSMNVYLKGFKIGKTELIYPDKDYSNTYIKVKLNRKYLNLPKNISAKIVRNKGTKYINLIYPASPAIERLKNNEIIKGKTTKDITNLMNEQFVDEGLEDVINDATGLLDNANNAVNTLDGIFKDIRVIIREVRPNIEIAAENLAKTSNSLRKTAKNIDSSVDNGDIAKSIQNIENITNNLKDITDEIDNTTMPIINNTLCEIKSTTENASEITDEINYSVKERKGILKFLLGNKK